MIASQFGELSVKGVITVDGKPLPGGTIILFSRDDQLAGSKIKDGKFKVDRVAVGDYTVALDSEGIPPSFRQSTRRGLDSR